MSRSFEIQENFCQQSYLHNPHGSSAVYIICIHYIYGHFKGHFEGAKAFLTPTLSLSKNYKIESPWFQKDIKLPMFHCLRNCGT